MLKRSLVAASRGLRVACGRRSVFGFRGFCSEDREQLEFDVVVVGAGVAGLSTAIQLRQLARSAGIADDSLSIAVLEKGSEVGSHVISGNVFNPRALDELIPEWRADDSCPVGGQPVESDLLWYLSAERRLAAPSLLLPSHLRNEGHFVVSLSDTCKWLAQVAEDELDVMLLPGFAVDSVMFNADKSQVLGVYTSDVGRSKSGDRGPNFVSGAAIRARQLVLSEGCRGSVSEAVMTHFSMRGQSEAQVYALGFKEVWEASPQCAAEGTLKPGTVLHTLGWPVLDSVYGGGFVYTTQPHSDEPFRFYLGIAISLEYSNPYFDPYKEFQRFKTHPAIAQMLRQSKAQCISYGARALNEGGFQSIPESMSFNGGLIVGCGLGFVNTAQVKGTHYAMKSGMLAAQSIVDALQKERGQGSDTLAYGLRLSKYDALVRQSWICKELWAVRNVKPAFNYGKWPGLLHSALSTSLTFGYEPWTLSHGSKSCAQLTEKVGGDSHKRKALQQKVAHYSELKYDNELTFDILTNLQRANTFHAENEPSHLKLKAGMEEYGAGKSLAEFGAPETRFCPAQVYECDDSGQLTINSQNCIHCKTCDIKAPDEYIQWTAPAAGGGPKYESM